MNDFLEHPKKRPIPERDLTARELGWIREITEANKRWSDVDVSATRVVAACDCGACRTVYLDSERPQNPSLQGTRGYVGRIEIRTADDFGITIALDQFDGRLSQLYINHVDLSDQQDRSFPEQWEELAHVIEPM